MAAPLAGQGCPGWPMAAHQLASAYRKCAKRSGIVPKRSSSNLTLFSSGQVIRHEHFLWETPGKIAPTDPRFVRQSVKFVHYVSRRFWDGANEANPESTQGSSPLEVESFVPEPPGRKRSQREGDDTPRSTLHASRLTPTVASESGGSGERRVAPGGCREGEHETVVSSQWSVVSESGGGEGRAASGDSEDGEPERSEPTQEECRAPPNVQNEANPESTQSLLPLEVESSVPEPGRRKRSQSTQAVAREQWSVASECEAGEIAEIEKRLDRHQ